MFTAIVFVLTSGCAWRYSPPSFGVTVTVTVATAHRRFAAWTKAGLWPKLHRAVLDRLGGSGDLDWSSAILDAASVRGKKGGSLTGPNPVDRAKTGSKIHVLSDAEGIPLVLGVSGANLHDNQALIPMPVGIPAVRSHRGPRRRRPTKLRADKAYDSGRTSHLAASTRNHAPHRPPWNRHRRTPRSIPLKKIERTLTWLTGYHRPTLRYEVHGHHFGAFLARAAALACFKKLPT